MPMSCTVNLAECRSLTDDALIAISSGEMALHNNRCGTQTHTHTHTRTGSDALSVHCRVAWLGRHVCLCLLEAHQSRPGWPWQCAITSQAILPRWSLQSTSLLTNSAITIAKLTHRFGACTQITSDGVRFLLSQNPSLRIYNNPNDFHDNLEHIRGQGSS